MCIRDSTVTVQSVKERELPELNDEFAQLASEFDTLDELKADLVKDCLLYTSPSPRDRTRSRMPSSA